MSVKAITPAVLPGSGHVRILYADRDYHDAANDAHVEATFDDLLGLPDPPRRRVRGLNPVSQTSRPSSAASTHRAAPDTPSPGCSARAVSPKETHV